MLEDLGRHPGWRERQERPFEHRLTRQVDEPGLAGELVRKIEVTEGARKHPCGGGLAVDDPGASELSGPPR